MLIVSAGDAITAKLVEEAGFDGIWVSGFETSARLGLPDNGSITMTEMLTETRKIVDAVSIPVYVDVDTGYGNLARTAKEFERIGARGICVEDNVFPKENSLFGGKLPLEDMVKHGERIREAREGSSIEIIARTEALIRGYGIREALKRIGFFMASGADWGLIHSRDITGKEVKEVAETMAPFNIDLVTIPTKFPQVKCKELYRMGYKMIVWANHTERVKIKAIRMALAIMKKADCPLPIEGCLAVSLEDLRGLTSEG